MAQLSGPPSLTKIINGVKAPVVNTSFGSSTAFDKALAAQNKLLPTAPASSGPTVTGGFGAPNAMLAAPTNTGGGGSILPGTPATISATGTSTGTDPTTPDYWSQIVNEPGYMQLQQNLTAQGVQAAQTRKQQTNQALAQFGEIPDLSASIQGLGLDPNSPMYQTLFGDIDPSTAQAAQALTQGGLSTTAGLDKQHQTDIGNLLDQMAAHGTVQSGGTGVGLGQADQAYSQNQFNARTSLINYLTGVQSAFNQQQQTAAQQLQQGAADAVARLMAQNPALGTGNPPPPTTQPLNLAAGLG